MSTVLSQFSPTICSRFRELDCGDRIDLVCDRTYTSQEQARRALRGLGKELKGRLSCSEKKAALQGLFDKIVNSVPVVSLLELPSEIIAHIITLLPPDDKIPLVCRQLYVAHRAVRCERLFGLLRDNRPSFLFSTVDTFFEEGIAVNRLEEIIRTHGGGVPINQAVQALQLENRAQPGLFTEEASEEVVESGSPCQTVLMNIDNAARRFLENLPEKYRAGLDGTITLDKAVQLFRSARDYSLEQLFEGLSGNASFVAENEESFDWLRKKLNSETALRQQAEVRYRFLQHIGDKIKEIAITRAFCFPPELSLCSRITSISISDSTILSVPMWIFCLRVLEILRLDRVGLQSLPDELAQIVSLRVLTAEGNDLTKVPPLYRLPNLSHVDLRNNQIGSINYLFLSLPNLKRVRLSGNSRLQHPKDHDAPTIERLRKGDLILELP